MDALFAEGMTIPISMEAFLSIVSLIATAYFWFVRSRRERPQLQFFQLHAFRASLRSSPGDKSRKRLLLTQVSPGGVLVANHSTRQNAILRFDCTLNTRDELYEGDWGWVGEDTPPWNIGPESSAALSLSCSFDVPADFSIPDDLHFRIDFHTIAGKRFGHVFYLQPPSSRSSANGEDTEKRAA